MIRKSIPFFAAILALLIASGQAVAGDDGAKRDARIQVVNNFGSVIGVIVDADEDDLLDAANSPNPEQAFRDLGGRILNAGRSTEFTVRAGAHQIFVVDAADFTNTATLDVSLNKGARRTATVSALANGDIRIQ